MGRVVPVAKPVLYSTYLQVNTVRGYRYLDDCGKILNKYDKEFPNKNWQLQGLALSNPVAPLRGLNVTVDRIWLQFERPDTLTYAVDNGSRIVEEVCEILAVDTFSRFGLRVQYLHGASDLPEVIRRSQQAVFSDALMRLLSESDAGDESTFEVMLRLKHADLPVDFRVSPVKRTGELGEPGDLPALAMMTDADLHWEGELGLSDFHRFLRSAQGWIRASMPAAADVFLSGGK